MREIEVKILEEKYMKSLEEAESMKLRLEESLLLQTQPMSYKAS